MEELVQKQHEGIIRCARSMFLPGLQENQPLNPLLEIPMRAVFEEAARVLQIPGIKVRRLKVSSADIVISLRRLLQHLQDHHLDLVLVMTSYFKNLVQEHPLPQDVYACDVSAPKGMKMSFWNYTPGNLKEFLDSYWGHGDLFAIVEKYLNAWSENDLETSFRYLEVAVTKYPKYLFQILRGLLANPKHPDFRDSVIESRLFRVMKLVSWWRFPLRLKPYSNLVVRLPRFRTRIISKNFWIGDLGRIAFGLESKPYETIVQSMKFLKDYIEDRPFPRFNCALQDIKDYPKDFLPQMRTMLLIWKRLLLPKDILLSKINHYILWNCFWYESPFVDYFENHLQMVRTIPPQKFREELLTMGHPPDMERTRPPPIDVYHYISTQFHKRVVLEFTSELRNFYRDYGRFLITAPNSTYSSPKGLSVSKGLKLLREKKALIRIERERIGNRRQRFLDKLFDHCTFPEIRSRTVFET